MRFSFLLLLLLLLLYFIAIAGGRVNIVCSEIPFGVDSYRKETSQFICIPNQLPGFCTVQISAEWNYQIDFN